MKSSNGFKTVWTLLKSSGQFWNCLDTIETVQTELKPSGQYWNKIVPFYIIRAKIFRTRKIFPVSNADALTGFLGLCSPALLTQRASHTLEKCPKNVSFQALKRWNNWYWSHLQGFHDKCWEFGNLVYWALLSHSSSSGQYSKVLHHHSAQWSNGGGEMEEKRGEAW